MSFIIITRLELDGRKVDIRKGSNSFTGEREGAIVFIVEAFWPSDTMNLQLCPYAV